jgi:biotin transporter BioY
MGATQDARLRAYRIALGWGTPTKLAVAAGFAGMLALLSQVSLPLPWTPVPFTLQVFGVFLAGTMLGPRYALASIAIYLLAGAAGLHVFAPSADAANPDGLWSGTRWRMLVPDAAAKTGFTAGYLFGFAAAAWFVGSWMSRRSRRLAGPLLWSAAGALVLLLFALAAGSAFLGQGGRFAGDGSGFGYTARADLVWLCVGLAALLVPATAWWIRRRQGSEGLELYLVLLAATALIHLPGVAVLKLTLGWGWAKSVALGSAVFLPLDAAKAGLAVAVSKAFLPSHADLERRG